MFKSVLVKDQHDDHDSKSSPLPDKQPLTKEVTPLSQMNPQPSIQTLPVKPPPPTKISPDKKSPTNLLSPTTSLTSAQPQSANPKQTPTKHSAIIQPPHTKSPLSGQPPLIPTPKPTMPAPVNETPTAKGAQTPSSKSLPKKTPVRDPAPKNNASSPSVKTAPPTSQATSAMSPVKQPVSAPSQEKKILAPNVAPTQTQAPKVAIAQPPVKPVREAAKMIDDRVESEKQKADVAANAAVEKKVAPEKNPAAEQDVAPELPLKQVMFAWPGSNASVVHVTGSFNQWKEQVLLQVVDGKHSVSLPLATGKYLYKFIVDGEWCYDFTKPNEPDADGNVNNVVTV